MRHLIGRFHEIALKGKNRWRFVDQLKRNLRATFADYRLGPMRGEGPRLMVELPEDLSDEVARERASLMFGLQTFSIGRPAARDLDEIKSGVLDAIRGCNAQSFRILTRRADKQFAFNSPEIDRAVGAAVKEATGIKVDLEHPELTIGIEILPTVAFFSIGKYSGPGGLPVGVSGHAVALISGGIDSPVAAYRMMRRGLRLDFVHFHSFPLLSAASREKARDLVAHLTRYQARSNLILVPFAELQRRIVAQMPRPLRVVLYRRFMMRIASALAVESGATALVTGESLGQVASQTLENMTVITQAATLPVFRPLVGMDKNEIVDQARRLGTFETSIIPDQDCCTLFVPAHPETHARREQVEQAESMLEVDAMVADALGRSERVRLSFPRRSR
ncbi:MAG TPA: tRNA uracil 4-sulfurtransferase ThiI [Candidatus Binataceae bacterium]|nr:tRNA uracil 4-sulfurtransferase ThiI [Candidatus Binataceae bacterium]